MKTTIDGHIRLSCIHNRQLDRDLFCDACAFCAELQRFKIRMIYSPYNLLIIPLAVIEV
jgi:hypothetical protein